MIYQLDEGNSISIELILFIVPFLSENSKVWKFKGIVKELLLSPANEILMLLNRIKKKINSSWC